jgi:CheY-like chemotaxis protein
METRDCEYVLVVEDDEDLREAFEMLLKTTGHAVASVGDGNEALTWLRGGRRLPCMVVLDLLMPRMNGFDLRSAMKADPTLRKVPVVVVTGAGALATQRQADLDAEILKKPVGADDLLQVVDRYCAGAAG